MQRNRFNEYVWELDQESKEKLIEKTRFPYHENKHFYDDLPVNHSAIKAHESGRLKSLGLEVAYELCEMLQDELLIPLNGEERNKAEGEIVEVGGRKRRPLDPSFQKMLFAPYKTNRDYLQRITGESKKNIERYSNLERETIPEEVYQKVLEDLKSWDQERIQVTGHIAMSSQAYNSEKNLDSPQDKIIIKKAGPKQVMEFTEGVVTARNLREIDLEETKKELRKFNDINRFIDGRRIAPDILKYLEANEIISEFPNFDEKYFIDRADDRVIGFTNTLDLN